MHIDAEGTKSISLAVVGSFLSENRAESITITALDVSFKTFNNENRILLVAAI